MDGEASRDARQTDSREAAIFERDVLAKVTEVDSLVERWNVGVERLRAFQSIDEESLSSTFGQASALVRELRAEVTRASAHLRDEVPTWTSRDEFMTLLSALTEQMRLLEKPRAQLMALAQILANGSVRHRSPRKAQALDQTRAQAATELRVAATRAVVPSLDGPEGGGPWLEWAWSLAGDALLRLLDSLSEDLASLAGFVEGVEPSFWHPGVAADKLSVPDMSDPGKHDSEKVTPIESDSSRPEPDASLETAGDKGHSRSEQSGRQEPEGGVAPDVSRDHATVSVPSGKATPGGGARSEAARAIASPIVLPSAKSLHEGGRKDARATSPEPDQTPAPQTLEPLSGSTSPHSHEGAAAPAAASTSKRTRADSDGQPSEGPDVPSTEGAHVGNACPQTPAPEVGTPPPTYEDYIRQQWLAPNGTVGQAPWQLSSFKRKLANGVGNELIALRDAPGRSLLRLWLYCSAAEALKVPCQMRARDLEHLAEIWASPSSGLGGVDVERSQSLWQALEQEMPVATPEWRLTAFLAAVRPSQEIMHRSRNVAKLVDSLEYSSRPLALVVKELMTFAARGQEGLELIRRGAKALPAETSEELRDRLNESRCEFHREMTRLWNAAGGKIQRSHCRDVWSRFIEKSSPMLRALFPEENGGYSSWDQKALTRHIEGLPARHEELAEGGGAKMNDRHVMDRAALRITELAKTVNDLYGRIETLKKGRRTTVASPELIKGVRHLMDTRPLEAPEEELCRRLLISVLNGKPWDEGRHPMAVTGRLLLQVPPLIGVVTISIDSGLVHCGSEVREVAHPRDIRDPVRAAAIMLEFEPLEADPGDSHQPVSSLSERLAQSGCAMLQPLLLTLLPKRERHPVQEMYEQIRRGTQEKIHRLQRQVQLLNQLAHRFSDRLKEYLEDAERRVETPKTSVESLALFPQWLEALSDYSQSLVERELWRLERKAEGHPRGREVKCAIDARRYHDALWLLNEPGEGRHRPVRQTMWRADGKAQYPNPSKTIAGLDTELAVTWASGLKAQPTRNDRKIRTALAKHAFPGDLYKQGENRINEYTIASGDVRDWLASQKLNPSFVPQLKLWGEIIIITPPVRLSDRQFTQKLSGQVSVYENSLLIVPIPHLTPEKRGQVRLEIDRRGARVAILDDLDLCRLLNIGGHDLNPVLALLELALEQQDAKAVSPFGAHDGQLVRMEMFVGRRHEAQRLARTDSYSRLFSGRKLGKSALLRYVSETEDGTQLPSGNTLRVLYVPAVGTESEVDLVGRIVECMRKALDYETDGGEPPEDAGDNLVSVMKRFVEERSEDSLLVVLDEADWFVESQLDAYEKRREKCLSFRMRTDIESIKDGHGLPRVRFLFSGYRTTHTVEGAWANWGDVLRLTPLEPREAAELIEGPLARLGFDVREEAQTIAWRCAYQPAVILRFGQQLLEQLTGSRARRSAVQHVKVTSECVVSTFDRHAVQDEIRTVVRNNFQGNRRGLIIFYTLLLEFHEKAPWAELENAPRHILDRLNTINGGLAWLHTNDSSALSVIEGMLRDFVARELLKETGTPLVPSYRLRFPHHLPLLVRSQRLENSIADEIQALKSDGGQVTVFDGVRALVSPTQLKSMQEVVSRPPDSEISVKAAVAASLWSDAVNHSSGGIADRLGIPPESVVRYGHARMEEKVSSRKRVAVVGVPGRELPHVLQMRPENQSAPLLTGGVDLLRFCLARQRETDDFYELCPVGRLAQLTVRWWFERIRGLEFESADAVERIFTTTSGIPSLVDIIDRLLLGPSGDDSTRGGINISNERLQAMEKDFGQELELHAKQLHSGLPQQRLDPRELEILCMHEVVYKEQGQGTGGDIREDLTKSWDILFCEHLDVPALNEQDRIPLMVLQYLGFLPCNPDIPPLLPFDRLCALRDDDALLKLAPFLGSAR